MRHNTTGHLVQDMERFGEHLGIGRWLLTAGSWGTTLALVYGERHPQRHQHHTAIGTRLALPRRLRVLPRGMGTVQRRGRNRSGRRSQSGAGNLKMMTMRRAPAAGPDAGCR